MRLKRNFASHVEATNISVACPATRGITKSYETILSYKVRPYQISSPKSYQSLTAQQHPRMQTYKLVINLACLLTFATLGGLAMRYYKSLEIAALTEVTANNSSIKSIRISAVETTSPSTVQTRNAETKISSSDEPTLLPMPVQAPVHTCSNVTPSDIDEQAALLAKSTARIDRIYASLFKHFETNGRTPSKIRAALIERQMIASEILALAREQGVDPTDRIGMRPYHTLVSNSVKEYMNESRLAIGETDYSAYLEWEKMRPEYYVAERISAHASNQVLIHLRTIRKAN